MKVILSILKSFKKRGKNKGCKLTDFFVVENLFYQLYRI